MQDTYYYIDSDRRLRSSNGDVNDSAFYLKGNYVHGPKNSGQYWIEDDQVMSEHGDTGYRVQADNKIFGPSQHLPWFD
jgi:hypothetical protein